MEDEKQFLSVEKFPAPSGLSIITGPSLREAESHSFHSTRGSEGPRCSSDGGLWTIWRRTLSSRYNKPDEAIASTPRKAIPGESQVALKR